MLKGVGSTSSGAGVPATVPGLQFWFKADGESYSDTDLVPIWHDLSTNGWNATQADSAKQPRYAASQQNSLPGIFFDGTDDILSMGNVFDNPANMSIFLVVTYQGSPNASCAISKTNWAGNSPGYAIYNFGQYLLWQSSAGNYAVTNTGTPYSGAVKITCSTKGPSEVDLKQYINTVDTGSVSSTGTPTNNSSTVSNLILGGTTDDLQALCLQGYLHEVIGYNTVVSASDRAKLFTYLNGKWAVY